MQKKEQEQKRLEPQMELGRCSRQQQWMGDLGLELDLDQRKEQQMELDLDQMKEQQMELELDRKKEQQMELGSPLDTQRCRRSWYPRW